MKYSLIQYDDIKSRKLCVEFERFDINLYRIKGSPIVAFLSILKYIVTKGRPNSIIFRYLNDYPSIIKTILRMTSEATSILISMVFRIDIIWICHNVDKESKEFYPLITRIRRHLFTKASKKILVTDKLLVEKATNVFKDYRSKIDYISFGPNIPADVGNEKEQNKIIHFINKIKGDSTKEVIVGLCASSANEKNISYEKAVQLVKESQKTRYRLILIFVGEINDTMRKRNEGAYEYLDVHPDVLMFNKKFQVDEKKMAPYVDFYWRAYLDQSVPFTVYNAATIGKPILTTNVGFLGEMVNEYRIGITIYNYNNIEAILDELKTWNKGKLKSFLHESNWETAAKRLYNCIISE
ncbi:Glycosyl transferases group 1 [Evansella caseinilytica]|uniref:Glycosyl transferases group 1 n=1 Tax=Evansella caseinilytica TaxID=1503961 RepID=A0A1H3T8I5_9BACI|nr:glycosyltransferase [Evansella caseinilytica]SDZ46653.1 Glycosyl transferases group 1 [Evansella caseinilytica]